MLTLIRSLLPVVLAALVAGTACADSEGQEDLDKATDAKLSATTISDLGEVVRLAESALEKGLDEANTDFANKLLASTLLLRARETSKQIRAGARSPHEFRQKRDFALSDLERVISLDPKQPGTYLLVAQLNLLPEGNIERAQEAVEQALQLGFEEPSERAKAMMLRATLQKEPEKKLADLDEAVRLAPKRAAGYRTRGLLLADLDKLEPALVDLDKVIELDPDNGPIHEAKAIILSRLKRYDEALAALEKARRLSPHSVMPLLQQARVHTSQEKLEAALEDINEALALAPGNVTVLLMRASLHETMGDRDKALADVDKALALAPDNVTVLLMRTSLHEAMGHREKALADVDEALKLKPDLVVAIRTRAVLLAESRRFDEAVAELQKIRNLQPKDTLTLLQLAVLYNTMKKMDESIDAYTALLAEDPEQWRALRGRGDVYLNVGRQAEAVADYEIALKLSPKDYGILNNLAWVLATSPDAKLRDGKRAIELATEACEVTEYKLAYILSTLAAAYAESGDFPTAIEWSSKAIEIGDQQHDEALKKELESYKAGNPWRESLSEGKPVETSADQPDAKP